MIYKFKNRKGFSLIEIILAVSIFSLSVMGLTGGLIYGQQSSMLALHRAQAVFLANEGLEASQNIGRESFANLVDGSFGLSTVGGSYSFSNNNDLWDIYERQVVISSINVNTKQVTSNVSWSLNVLDEGQVSLITYITNWQ